MAVSAVRDQVKVANSGRSQQWSVPLWLCSVLCGQCSLVLAVAVAPCVPTVAAVVVDLVFSVASCVLLWFSAASGFSLEALAWCDDWALVVSRHGVFSWFLCFAFLCEALAWCQWVLTQALPQCPDGLLLSALFFSAQSCLCPVFLGVYLVFGFLLLHPTATCTPHAQPHAPCKQGGVHMGNVIMRG